MEEVLGEPFDEIEQNEIQEVPRQENGYGLNRQVSEDEPVLLHKSEAVGNEEEKKQEEELLDETVRTVKVVNGQASNIIGGQMS